jgi:hypothetical protein
MRNSITRELCGPAVVCTCLLSMACGNPPAPSSPATATAASSTDPERSPEALTRRTVEGRAVEAVIWGMPVVNFDRMYQAMASQVKGSFNQIVYWSRLPDWKNQTLTPNPDAIYLMPFFDTKSGPIVLEIPAADEGTIVGSVMDCWQTAIEDVGPAGVDKGKGGRYFIYGPDFTGTVPDGFIPMASDTHQGYALLRSILKSGSDADVAKAVAYAKRIKFYPYANASNPPATTFLDAIDVVFDATIPYDLRFFQSLDRMVQSQPWLTRDKVMIDALKSIGIEKGKPFAPDPATQDLLKQAATDAHAWLDAKYTMVYATRFDPSARWTLPVLPEVLQGLSTNYADPNAYPVDGRGLTYSYGFFSAKHLGAGQYYLMTIVDKAGQSFDGGSSYRLTVPPNAPVTQYWSATVYDRATHALIRDMKWSSRSSQSPNLQKNPDGSVDVYFGPTAPAGKDSNWVPTNPRGQFEVLFRLYGPQKPFFDKVWKLPDIERMR